MTKTSNADSRAFWTIIRILLALIGVAFMVLAWSWSSTAYANEVPDAEAERIITECYEHFLENSDHYDEVEKKDEAAKCLRLHIPYWYATEAPAYLK